MAPDSASGAPAEFLWFFAKGLSFNHLIGSSCTIDIPTRSLLLPLFPITNHQSPINPQSAPNPQSAIDNPNRHSTARNPNRHSSTDNP